MTTATKKKRSPMKKAKTGKGVAQAPAESCFWVHYGPILGNLYELEGALKVMSEEQYLYHANEAKNDFARWTKDVLKEKILAQKLLRAKTKEAACKIVSARLKTV